MSYGKNFQLSVKILVSALLTVGMLTACGQEQKESRISADRVREETIAPREDPVNAAGEENKEVSKHDEVAATNEVIKTGEAAEERESETEESAVSEELIKRFGTDCITEQTFEVELSEYDGKVWFVPYVSAGGRNFHIQIIQGK